MQILLRFKSPNFFLVQTRIQLFVPTTWYVYELQNVQIYCNVTDTGDYQGNLTFYWTKLPSFQQSGQELYLSLVTYEDSGVYVCSAVTDDHVITTASVTVTVWCEFILLHINDCYILIKFCMKSIISILQFDRKFMFHPINN